MDEEIKNQQWIVSNLLQRIIGIGMENKAYRRLLSADLQAQSRFSELRYSGEFASLAHKLDEHRKKVLRAVADRNNVATYEAIASLVGEVDH